MQFLLAAAALAGVGIAAVEAVGDAASDIQQAVMYETQALKAELEEDEDPDPPSVKGYVVSMHDTDVGKARLADFQEAWKSAWPSLEMQVVDGVPDKRRGVGITKSFVNVLRKAADDGCDLCVVFEDDARPFKDVKFPQDMMAAVDKAPTEYSVILLGGHQIEYSGAPSPLTRIHRAWGAYAWTIPKRNVRPLGRLWDAYAHEVPDSNATAKGREDQTLSPDIKWAEQWSDSAPAFIATPLLVDHPHGFSENWGKDRKDAWSGHRDWQNVPGNAHARKVGRQDDGDSKGLLDRATEGVRNWLDLEDEEGANADDELVLLKGQSALRTRLRPLHWRDY